MPLTPDPNADVIEKAKLLRVRAIVETLLREHDLCADVVLAGRGRIEVFTHLDATWSRVAMREVEGGHALRLRSKLADYGGDKDKQREDLEDTLGMVSSFAHVKLRSCLAWDAAANYLDEVTGAEHTPLRPEPPETKQ